jgi:hypothetical protein
MFKWWNLSVILLFFFSVSLYTYDITEYAYKSKYDAAFAVITDTNTILSALNDKDDDVVYSALRRVGQLRISAAKAKVEEIVSEANPEVNQGKSEQRTEFKKLYDMGVLVLGKIGNADDAIMLSKLIKETKDNISLVCLLQALGDLNMSDTALQYLHQYTSVINNYSDYRVVKTLVDSIANHKSKSSMGVLLELINKAPQNLREYINDTVKELSKLPSESSSNAGTNSNKTVK